MAEGKIRKSNVENRKSTIICPAQGAALSVTAKCETNREIQQFTNEKMNKSLHTNSTFAIHTSLHTNEITKELFHFRRTIEITTFSVQSLIE